MLEYVIIMTSRREFEKVVHNSVSVLKHALEDSRAVPGGGAVEMHISKELGSFALEFFGKEQLAIQSFANALEEIPRCLAQNNCLNPLDIIIELNNYHTSGLNHFGVGKDGFSDMVSMGIKDLAHTKSSVIRRAYEVAKLILRIDDFIFAKEIAKVHKK